MRKCLCATALILLFGIPPLILGDEADHFRKFTTPPDEARILALTGVREFRCDYEVAAASKAFLVNPGPPLNYQENLLLFAEYFERGTCVARYRLSVAVDGFHDLKIPEKGIMSFGWNEDKHQLISVIDNQQRYSPWIGSLVRKDFSYFDSSFFENGAPETRNSDTGTSNFVVYPVVGVCGYRQHKLQESGYADSAAYLKACNLAQSKGAIIIYLYKSALGEEPPLKFDP
jgi:hypothetical protein